MQQYSVEAYLKATGVAQFSKAFQGAAQDVGQVDKSSKKANITIGSMIKTIAGVGAAIGIFNTLRSAVGKAFDRIDTMEQFERVMTTMLGSSKEANKVLNETGDIVTGTAYGLDTAANSVQRFVTSSVDVNKATKYVESFGNAVAFYGDGSDETFGRVNAAMAEMASSGKASLGAVRTLTESTIPVFEIYGEAVGKTGAQVQKELETGKISADEFLSTMTKAFDEGTASFPSLANAAREAGGSWRNTFGNMGAAATRGVISVIDAIDRMLADNGLPEMRQMIALYGKSIENSLKSIASFVEPIGNAFFSLLRVIKKVMPVIVGLVSAYASMMIIQKVSMAIKFHTAMLLTADLAQKTLMISTKGGTVAIAAQTGAIKLSTFAVGVLTGRITLAQAAQIAFTSATTAAGVALKALWGFIAANPVAIIIGLAIAMVYLWKTSEQFRDVVSSAWDQVKSVFESLAVVMDNVVQKAKGLGDSFSSMVEPVNSFMSAIQISTLNAFGAVMDWIGNVGDYASQGFQKLSESGVSLKDSMGMAIGPIVAIATTFLGLASPIGWLIKGFALLATQTTLFSDIMKVFNGEMSIGELVNNFATDLSSMITNMAETASEMITKGSEMITGFLESFTAQLPELTTAGVEIVTNVITGITDNITQMLPVAVEMISTFVESLVSAIPMLLQTGVTILTTIIEAIVGNLPMMINTYMEIVTTLINTVVTMLPLIIQVVIQLLQTIITTIVTMLPMMIETYMTIIQLLIDTILMMLPLLIETFITLIMLIVQILIENLPLLIDAGIQILTAIIDGIITVLPTLITAILTIVEALIGVVIDNLPLIISAGIQILLALIDGIIKILPSLIDAGIQLIIALVGILIKLLPQLIQAGIQILMALIKGIIQILPQLISAGINLIIQLVSAIIGMLPQLLSAGVQLITSLISGIFSMVGSIFNAGKDLVDKALDGITGSFGKFLDAGKNIVGSIADGIKGAVGAVTGAIGNVASKIRDFLPFSPAKEGALRDIMKIQIPQSIAESIKKGQGSAVKAMSNLSDAIYGEMPQVDIAGQVANSNASINSRIDHEMNNANSNYENLLREALNRKQAIVLDTGALVGGTKDVYNRSFGDDAKLEERWG